MADNLLMTQTPKMKQIIRPVKAERIVLNVIYRKTFNQE